MDSKEALERASLVRSDPSLDGVSRKNTSKVDGEYIWQYYSPGGEVVDDEEPINRWNSLGLPPAWEEVWICPNARGHIQATGRDDVNAKLNESVQLHLGIQKGKGTGKRKDNHKGQCKGFYPSKGCSNGKFGEIHGNGKENAPVIAMGAAS